MTKKLAVSTASTKKTVAAMSARQKPRATNSSNTFPRTGQAQAEQTLKLARKSFASLVAKGGLTESEASRIISVFQKLLQSPRPPQAAPLSAKETKGWSTRLSHTCGFPLQY